MAAERDRRGLRGRREVTARWAPPAALPVLALLALIVAGCGVVPSALEVVQAPEPGATPSTIGAGSATSTPADVPSDVPDPLARFYQQELKWEECKRAFQCTKLEVPIDYDDPGGDTIELAVLRFPAKDPQSRIGSLVLNPGGPGGSGQEIALASPNLYREPVKQRYDIVGFDPRGVGESAPVKCLTDEQKDQFAAAEGVPTSDAEKQDAVRLAEEFTDGCAERTGDLLGHVDTPSAARDMDVLRGALGDRKLTYMGFSYGTYLGAVYADLFPERVGRFVLDGGIDPALSATEVQLGQVKGFERALKAFVGHCVSLEDCPLGGSTDEAYRTLDDLLADLDENPLPGDEERDVTFGLGSMGIIQALYIDAYWGQLRGALRSALEGDGAGLLALADEYARRSSDGTYRDNSSEAILAVNCLDRPDRRSVEDVEALEPQYEAASPRFGAFLLWGSLTCANWPVEPTGDPRKLAAKGAAPIVVIGTTGDPATPYEWSVSLAEQLESGVLLTNEGEGHTAYNTRLKDDCIRDPVDEFLISGTVPEDGLTCSV